MTAAEAISRALATGKPLLITIVPSAPPPTGTEPWNVRLLAHPDVGAAVVDSAVCLTVVAGSVDFRNLADIFRVPAAAAVVGIAAGRVFFELARPVDAAAFVQSWSCAAARVLPPAEGAIVSDSSGPVVSGQDSVAQRPHSALIDSQPVHSSSAASPVPDAPPMDTRVPITPEVAIPTTGSGSGSGTRMSQSQSSTLVTHDPQSGSGPRHTTAPYNTIPRYKPEAVKPRATNFNKDERERILRLVQADRRECAARNKQPREDSVSNPPVHARSRPGATCDLAIRFLDGHQEKHTFGASDSLATVREWLGPRTTKQSYLFCGVFPRHVFDTAEEEHTLGDLGLAPSANLVLQGLAPNAEPDESWLGWLVSQMVPGFLRG